MRTQVHGEKLVVCAFIDEHVHDENNKNNSRPHEENNLGHSHR